MSSMTMDPEQSLRGFTNVLRLHLDARSRHYDLTLELGSDESGDVLRVIFTDVSNLVLSSFGGGLTQLRLLKIENLSDRQLERIRYHVSEVEDEILAFDCFGIDISQGNVALSESPSPMQAAGATMTGVDTGTTSQSRPSSAPSEKSLHNKAILAIAALRAS